MDTPPTPPPFHLLLDDVPESQPITVHYILIEPNLNIAISVDLPELLPMQSRQPQRPKQKQKPPKSPQAVVTEAEVLIPDTEGGSGVPADTHPEEEHSRKEVSILPCGLRYYIRYDSARESHWLLEYAYVKDATDDLPRGSSLYGLEQELTLRFANPPVTRGDCFKWPTGKRRVGVFRCMSNGTLDALQRGDATVARKVFFRIGMPTIRSEEWVPGSVFSVFAVRRLYSEAGSVDEVEEEGDGTRPLFGTPAKLKKKNNSLTSFLEFVGMTGSGVQHRSPKRIQLTDARVRARVTATTTAFDGEVDSEEALPKRPGLGRHARSWSGTRLKEEKTLGTVLLLQDRAILGEEPSTPKASITTPKKERSGFRVPFRRRDTHDAEKNKPPPRRSHLIRSISAADLTSSPSTEPESSPKGAVRLCRSSTDQKVVRFVENTRPHLGERGWAGSTGGIARTPAPPVLCCYSPETVTPPSGYRGGRFLQWEEDGEYLGMDTSSGQFRETLTGMDFAPSRKSHESQVSQGNMQPENLHLIGFANQRLYPSPVSPPDPEYIRQVEANMEAAYTTVNAQAFEDPPESEYELDISQMTEEQAYAQLVGPVSNWLHYPPMQVAEEFAPKTKVHWDWRALGIRGRDQFSGLGGPGLNVNDGSGIKWPATF